ncbi:MAG: methyltransferase domain-containing protein [Gemmatimonadales bacterium]
MAPPLPRPAAHPSATPDPREAFGSPIGEELLDHPDAPADLVRESLHHLGRSNRLFGGVAAARAGVRRLLAGVTRRVSLLDLGTGRGDIPLALGRIHPPGLALFGLDRHRAAAALATAAGVPTAVGDAFVLPFANRSVDVVLASQLAHHFAADGVVALAREASRVARLGVVIADLRRSWWAGTGFRLAARALGFDRYTREDGVTSLARGFRPADLAATIRTAGFEPVVTTHLGARVVATWRTA